MNVYMNITINIHINMNMCMNTNMSTHMNMNRNIDPKMTRQASEDETPIWSPRSRRAQNEPPEAVGATSPVHSTTNRATHARTAFPTTS